MLEQIVQKFRGIVLLLVVFALSAVFVLQFGGPQAQGCSGNGGGGGAVAKVYGAPISKTELQSAFVLANGEEFPEELAKQHKLKDMVLYGLIERELLVREAEQVGYRVSEDEVRRAQTILQSDFAYENETNASLTGTMAEFETLFGAAERYRDVLSGVASVTPARVREALAPRMTSDRAVRAWVGPDGA